MLGRLALQFDRSMVPNTPHEPSAGVQREFSRFGVHDAHNVGAGARVVKGSGGSYHAILSI